MIEIPLRNRDGELVGVALVDAVDARLAEHRWCLDDGYAHRRVGGRKLYLHREVVGKAANGYQVDHIDRDRLNCCRNNLRPVTLEQNAQNVTPRGRSRFRGVGYDPRRGLFYARGKSAGCCTWLGSWRSEVVAGAVAAQWRADNLPYSQEAMA